MNKNKQRLLVISDNQKIDYKDVEFLKLFTNEQGGILSRSLTGITMQQQRRIAKAIKRARILSLLPFVAKNNT